MKQPVISLHLHSGLVEINDSGFKSEHKAKLPDGCIGIMFVFESKKAAREFDPKASLCEIMVNDR